MKLSLCPFQLFILMSSSSPSILSHAPAVLCVSACLSLSGYCPSSPPPFPHVLPLSSSSLEISKLMIKLHYQASSFPFSSLPSVTWCIMSFRCNDLHSSLLLFISFLWRQCMLTAGPSTFSLPFLFSGCVRCEQPRKSQSQRVWEIKGKEKGGSISSSLWRSGSFTIILTRNGSFLFYQLRGRAKRKLVNLPVYPYNVTVIHVRYPI